MKSEDFKNHCWNVVKIEFLCFFLLIWIEFLCTILFNWWPKWSFQKSLLKFCKKSMSYVFFYFQSNSYVLYCLSDEKVMISKIILEISCKWISYAFFYFDSNSYAFILFKWWKSNDFKNHSLNFVEIEFLCLFLVKVGFLYVILFKWRKSEELQKIKSFLKFC